MIPRRLPAVLFILLLWGWSGAAAAGELAGRVTWVHDGDTVEVAGAGTVRLLGIDAPEREASDRDRFLLRRGVTEPALRQAARQARDFNRATLLEKTVRLVPGDPARDRYGRLLAYLYLPDGRLLNRLLIEQGLAVVYRRFEFSRKQSFLAAEADARRRQAGLWAR